MTKLHEKDEKTTPFKKYFKKSLVDSKINANFAPAK
jgi:hypothetical protein